MNEFEKKRLMFQVAQMYYQNDLTQAEISKRLNLSKPKVSRLLAEARQNKIVEIIIHIPYQNDLRLEKSLIEQYGLKDARVLVASGLTATELQSGVGILAAEVLNKYLRDQMILAISRGRNVYSTVKALTPRPELRLKIVQVQGALGDRLDDGSDLAHFLSHLYTADIRLLHAPLILETPEAAKTLLSEPSIKSTLALAKKADIALLGIGSVEPEVFSLYHHNILSLEEIQDLKNQGVVGDVAGCFIDQSGHEARVEFNRRLVRINLDDLRKIPLRIGVGCGLAREKAIRAVIGSNLVNILVTDSAIATRLLEDKCS